jgi:hypothetical protein
VFDKNLTRRFNSTASSPVSIVGGELSRIIHRFIDLNEEVLWESLDL